MSSLAATQADGYYIDAAHRDAGKDSKNKVSKSKGHNQFLQRSVVRFELPYKGICTGCKASIMRGTRYNAHKRTTNEKYFSASIYEFTMTCRQVGCSTKFCIRTNPQERGFDYVSGITIQKGQTDRLDEAASASGLSKDAGLSSLDRLETMATGKRRHMTEHESLTTLQNLNQQSSLHDADLNAKVRSRFRTDRKDKRARIAEGRRKGLGDMELLPATTLDQAVAKETVFGNSSVSDKQRFRSIRKSSIFSTTSKGNKKRDRKRSRSSEVAAVPSPVRSSSISSMTTNSDNREGNKKTPASNKKPKPKRIIPSRFPIKESSTPAATFDSMLSGYGSDSD